jgi:glycosyltransferase involved in cell wall biosynthesis
MKYLRTLRWPTVRWPTVPSARRRAPRAPLSPEITAHVTPRRLPRKPDLLCFSIIDWDFRYQRPQQILSRLARAGHRVFYLSQQFPLGPGDERFLLRPLAPGVTDVLLRSPRGLDIYTDALAGDIEDAFYEGLLALAAQVGLGEAICLVHLPFWTPLVLRLKADFGHRIVFDCLDDFGGFQNVGGRVVDLETTLAARADLVTATSRVLARKHAARNPLLVPNATDYAHFSAPTAPALSRDAPGPLLGYYGAIEHWFDAELVAAAAHARPEWRFVLIGRSAPAVRARLAGVPNIRLLPEIAYEEVPAHLAAFDVCLIPFVVDDLIKATNPVKFFEYLSACKPVVAARMPELLPFAGECFLYEGLGEFLVQVERALAEKDDPARVEARRAVAKANTWEMRVDVLRRALDGLYPRASVILPASGDPARTAARVQRLLENTAYGDWELILVDTLSPEGARGSLHHLSERYPLVRSVASAGDRGVAAVRDEAIRSATGDLVVLLEDDAVVTQGWLGRLLRHLDDPAVGMVASSRACVAMRRSLVGDVGMLDERSVGRWRVPGRAKVDLLGRFRRAVEARGYRIVRADVAVVEPVR